MRLFDRQGGSPKVVRPDIGPRLQAIDNGILANASIVIVTKLPVQGRVVPVCQDAGPEHEIGRTQNEPLADPIIILLLLRHHLCSLD